MADFIFEGMYEPWSPWKRRVWETRERKGDKRYRKWGIQTLQTLTPLRVPIFLERERERDVFCGVES